MREILFRGKRLDNGQFIYGDIHRHATGKMFIKPNKKDCRYSAEIIPETVGQYTGLTDKNGTKIFEGDIVKFGKNIYQITFECGSFALLDKQGFMIARIGGINDHCYSLMNLHLECCWEDDWAYDIEVIGTIHDNPELLKARLIPNEET